MYIILYIKLYIFNILFKIYIYNIYNNKVLHK